VGVWRTAWESSCEFSYQSPYLVSREAYLASERRFTLHEHRE
jgi:hypothetical protein